MLPKTPKEILSEFEKEFGTQDGFVGTGITPMEHTQDWLRSALTSLLLEAKGRMPKHENAYTLPIPGLTRENQEHMARHGIVRNKTISEAHVVIDQLITEVEQS